MDHAIAQLKDYMQATVEAYQALGYKRELIEREISTYVEAINTLEEYHYGGIHTTLEATLYDY